MVASDLPCLFGCIMTSLLIELQPLHAHMLQNRLSVNVFFPNYSLHSSLNPLALNRIFFFSWGVGEAREGPE